MSTNDDEIKNIFLIEIRDLNSDRAETLDKTFTFWICSNYLDLDDSQAEDAIEVGGKGDNAVDIFHVSEDPNTIHIFQAKFSKTLDYDVSRAELLEFITCIGRLELPPPTSSAIFKKKSEEYQAYRQRDYRVKMIYAVTGYLSQPAQDLLSDPIELAKYKDPFTDIVILDLTKILQFVKTLPTPDITIPFEQNIIETTKANRKSLTGYVKAKEIIRIYEQNSDRIFLENPRESLGLNSTNRDIGSSILNPELRPMFWKLNNGITAICESITTSDSEPNTWKFSNLKIVNGRQTTFSLHYNKINVDDSVQVLLRAHEAKNEDERDQISKATNTQNPIKPSDQISNRTEIKTLFLKIKKDHPSWYFESQRGAFKMLSSSLKNKITERRKVDKIKAARYFLAFNQKPWEAIKRSEFDLLIKHYEDIYENRKPEELMIPHLFFKVLEELTKKWKDDPSKEKEYNQIKLDIVKCYVLSLIADSLSQISDVQQRPIKKKLIDLFTVLSRHDPMHDVLLEIGEKGYHAFLAAFHPITGKTEWPSNEIKDKLLSGESNDPTNPLIVNLINQARTTNTLYGFDPIRLKLEKLIES